MKYIAIALILMFLTGCVAVIEEETAPEPIQEDIPEEIVTEESELVVVPLPEPKKSVIVEATADGVSLAIHKIEAVMKEADWGTFQGFEFTIKNEGAVPISAPQIFIYPYDENDPMLQESLVRDTVKLESAIPVGGSVSNAVKVTAGFRGDLGSRLMLRLKLVDGETSGRKEIVSINTRIMFE